MDSGLINTTWHCLGCVIPPGKKFAFTSEVLVLDLSSLCIYILSEISKPPLWPLAKKSVICKETKHFYLVMTNEQKTVAMFSKKQNIANFLTVLFLLITLPPTGYGLLKQNHRKKINIFYFPNLSNFKSYIKKRRVAILLLFLCMHSLWYWRGWYGRYAPVAGAGEEGQPVHLKSYQEIQRCAPYSRK